MQDLDLSSRPSRENAGGLSLKNLNQSMLFLTCQVFKRVCDTDHYQDMVL